MSYSDQQLEDLKERADIVAILGRRVQLKKVGKDHLGLCPFHGERTPSFNVIPSKHMYHCFGCQESGDIFKFFMKLDGMSFMEAIRHVASESGIMLTEEKHDPEEAKRRARLDELASLLDRAVKFYELKLWGDAGAAAREHLKKRGITDEYAKRFHLGFGGLSMDDLSRALKKAGVSIELATEAGLCIPGRRGDAFDRFHGRLIVPIRVPRPPDGRAIGLGARYLEGITDAGRSRAPDRKPAKYINSPETPLYQKSFVLYGLDQARDAIRKAERAVIVEGYFDVIGVHQAGLPIAVATCGTALTQQHLDLLMRTAAKEVVFLFDGDAAGIKAAAKAAEMCAKAQIPAKVATLPLGKDPDEFARQNGLEALQALLERAKPAVDMLIDKALDNFGINATVEDKVRAVREVRDIVMASRDELARDLYFNQIAEKLGVSPAIVKSAITDPVKGPARGAHNPSRQQERGPHGPVGPRRGPPPRQEEEAPPEEAPPWPVVVEALPDAPQGSVVSIRSKGSPETSKLERPLLTMLLQYPALVADLATSDALADLSPDARSVVDKIIEAEQQSRPFSSLDLPPALRARVQELLKSEQRYGEIEPLDDQQRNHFDATLRRWKKAVKKHQQRASPPTDLQTAQASLLQSRAIAGASAVPAVAPPVRFSQTDENLPRGGDD